MLLPLLGQHDAAAAGAARVFRYLGQDQCGSEAIVTGDQHLRKLKRFRGVLIAGPRDFLDAETRR